MTDSRYPGTTFNEDLIYLATHKGPTDDEHLTEADQTYLRHLADAYQTITEHGDSRDPEGQLVHDINMTSFMLALLDAGFSKEIAIRATELLDEDDTPWFDDDN